MRAVVTALLCVGPSTIYAVERGLVAQASSDWVYHGNSETEGQAAAGINIEWQWKPDLFFGLEAHQSRVPDEQQRHRAVMPYFGAGYVLSDPWYVTVTLLRREFPGSVKEWQFWELDAEFTHDQGWGIEFGYSPDYYAHDTPALHALVGYDGQFSDTRYWYTQIGNLRLDSSASDYAYLRIGGGMSWARLNFDLSYAWNDGDDEILFGEPISAPGLILQLSYRLR